MKGKRKFIADTVSKILGLYPPPSFAKNYEFVNRSKHLENLLLILAGYQPYYWEVLFERVSWAVKDTIGGIDVCICIPMGIEGAQVKLKAIADKYGWSVLYIKKNLLSQALNTTIKLFDNAKWILKIDEDIVTSENIFDELKKVYYRAEEECQYRVGYVGATINVNAIGVQNFLQSINLWSVFEAEFGKYQVGKGSDNLIQESSEVASFIWMNSIPFDYVASKVKNINAEAPLIIAPVNYSIGVMFFARSFWKDIGFFKVGNSGFLGVEERQVNNYCQNNMLGIVIAPNVLAGHLGFYDQKQCCREFFENNIEYIKAVK